MKTITLLAILLAIVLVSCSSASIDRPTEASTSMDIPTDIPIYSEHSDVLVLGDNGPFSYRAYADLETVSQFYQNEMVSQGWTQSQEPIIYDTEIILHFEKASKKVIIDMVYTNDFTGVGIALGP